MREGLNELGDSDKSLTLNKITEVKEMRKTYQINNLKIAYSKLYEKWQVRTLKGVVLEEFRLLPDAKNWANRTHDFIQR